MKRSVLNIIIDAISLVVFTIMISTGLVLKFILPPGSGRVETLLRGRGRYEKTIDLFMGLTRHEWGQIHFYVSSAFLVFLLVHLALHWNWIQAVAFGTKANPQPLKRKMIVIGILTVIALILLFPWIGRKETYTKSEFLIIRNIQINESNL